MDTELTKVQDYINQGSALYSVQNYADAKLYFEKALAEDPMNAEAYVDLAQAQIMLDEYSEARDSLKKASMIDKKNGCIYFHMGNIEMLEGQSETAKEYYAKAVSLGYADVQIYLNLATDAEEKGDYATALSYYEKVISRDKFNAYAKARKVQIFLAQNKLPEALKACDSMIETNPDVFEGYHYKFAILSDMGRRKDAEDVLNHALDLFPEDEGLIFDQVTLLDINGETEKAIEKLNEIKTNEQNESVVTSKRAQLYLGAGRYKDAKDILEPNFKKRNDSETGYYLTTIYMAEKEYDKALETSSIVVDKGERDSYYYAAVYFRAMSMKLGGKEGATEAIQEALSIFRAACVANPGYVQFYLYRAMCHKELREFEAALEMLDYITRVAPGLSEAFYLRSEIYKELNMPEKAEEDRAKAISLKPEIADLIEGK